MQHKTYIFIALFWVMGWQAAFAQFYPTQYRPPNLEWQQLSTPHFKVIFPDGEDSVAWETAHILEREYPRVQELTGGHLSNFPVILSNYNDRSNGLVTSLHFRSEIDISPIKGKELNPETGGWLENVMPHELTHAVEFSHLGGLGLGQMVNIFSPDLARSMHGALPAGIQEGLAVYFESNDVVPGGGRGNYAFFTNQFNAVFDSPSRWSMGQMVHFPAYSRPYSRHYIGGYEFTQWLQDTYGPKTSRDAIDFHIRWPFLGYGMALKHTTGQWPAQLYNAFEQQKEDEIGAKQTEYSPLPIELNGAEIRRPKWLSDSTLIFYGSFYNAASGFYQYDLKSQNLQRIITTNTVTDYNYSFTKNRDSLIYSFNQADVRYPNAFKSTLVQASLTNGSTTIINDQNRLYAPSFSSDSTVYALQTEHSHGRLSKLNEKTNRLVSLFYDHDYQLISVAASPGNPDSLAIIMNHHGKQALWLAPTKSLKTDLENTPSISFPDGSIFDTSWNPDGNHMLFSADFTGTFQVYEYNLESRSLTQITHAPYNAFEASYSPDGRRIALIIQRKNERLPVVLSRENFYGKQVDPALYNIHSSGKFPGLLVDATKDSSWQQSAYSTGFSWLKPRTVLPAIDEISGRDQFQFGAGLYSSDLLQEQSYALELTAAQKRLWYDLTYQSKRFFPGFKARFFSQPSFRNYQFVTQNKNTVRQQFLRQERSLALSVPMQFTLSQNIDYTSLYLEPEIRESQIRFFDENSHHSSDFSNTTIANIFGQFNYKLRQNIRDVQPSSGLLLYSELEHYLGWKGLTLKTGAGNIGLKSSEPTALRGGIFGYVAPFEKWNQSLRVGLEGITQTAPVFDNQSVVSDGFATDIFPYSNNLVSLNGRYTIPLFYPDNGGLLVPLYLSSVYISAFSDTVFYPVHGGFSSARSVFGAGLRVQFRISNLSFNIGAGIGLEPSRKKIHYFIGNF